MSEVQPHYSVDVRCADCGGTAKLLFMASAFTREYVVTYAALLDGTSDRYVKPYPTISPIGRCAICRGRIECEVTAHGMADPANPFACRGCSKPLAFDGFCSVACHTAADGLSREPDVCFEDDIGSVNLDMMCCGCAKHPDRYARNK